MRATAQETDLTTLCAAFGRAMDAQDRICVAAADALPFSALDRKRDKASDRVAKLARDIARRSPTSEAELKAKAVVAYRLADMMYGPELETWAGLDIGMATALSLVADLAGDFTSKLVAAGYFASSVKPTRGGRRPRPASFDGGAPAVG